MPILQAKVSESLTLALLGRVREMRAKGEDVASLAAGEPDFPTPDFVVDAAVRSMKAGNTKYVASQGVPAFREAVARDYRNRYGVSWVTPEHVVVTGGSKQGIHVTLSAAVKPGDEVLLPKPYWVSYPSLVKAVDGIPKELATQEKNGYFPTVDELEKAWTPKTKALMFSSPGNPSGLMISRGLLAEILEWCNKRKVMLVYDEIYERLVLKDKPHVCPLSLCASEAEAENVLVVNALSKTLSMTGWRLGYVVGHRQTIQALTALQTQFITCLPGFIQDAGVEGLTKAGPFLAPVVELFKDRLKVLLEELKKIPGVRWVEPEGAFYVMADVSAIMARKGISNDREFCERLLQEKRAVIIPGASMGMPGWVRLSFATSHEEIRDAIKRLGQFCSEA